MIILGENACFENGYVDNTNTMLIGAPGTGKTRSYVLPNLMSTEEESVVVLDPKGEIYDITANLMREKGYDSKNQISLEGAAEFFGVNTEEFSLHTALDDSTVCGKLLKICYNAEMFTSLLRDAKDPEFNRRLHFKAYPITDINDAALDKGKFCFACPECGGKLNRLSKWKYRNRWFSSPFGCPKCNHKYIGRVFAKMTFDGVTYKQRLLKVEKKEQENELQSVSTQM